MPSKHSSPEIPSPFTLSELGEASSRPPHEMSPVPSPRRAGPRARLEPSSLQAAGVTRGCPPVARPSADQPPEPAYLPGVVLSLAVLFIFYFGL